MIKFVAIAKPTMSPKRNAMSSQETSSRAHSFDEGALGYTEDIAIDDIRRIDKLKIQKHS